MFFSPTVSAPPLFFLQIIPGFLEIGIDAADTCNTSINTITSGAGSILTQVGDVYIPQIEGDVLTGTQTLVDATDNLVTALGALDEVTGGNFDTKTYTCLVCSTLVTNAGDLTTQVGVFCLVWVSPSLTIGHGVFLL